MTFNVNPEPESDIQPADFIFETNYTALTTNIMVTPEGDTNFMISTNRSVFTLEFSGVSESAKQEMIIEYVSLIVEALFN